jgi:hypothetical protein
MHPGTGSRTARQKGRFYKNKSAHEGTRPNELVGDHQWLLDRELLIPIVVCTTTIR